jgi:hypothetical protein
MADSTFDHVVITLMNINVKHHRHQVLWENGITSAYEIIRCTEDMLSSLETDEMDDNDTLVDHDKPIPIYHQALILILGNFFCEKK